MFRRRSPKWLEAARAQGVAGQDWLARALPRAGLLPFHEVEQAIRDGRCAIDGTTVRDPWAAVVPHQQVSLDGRSVSIEAPTLVLMLHKPAGVVTAGTDPEGGGTVFEVLAALLPAELSGFGWHAVGRLDRATTGLLLFSNDERFVEHASSPESHLPKTYVATTDGGIDDSQITALLNGVTIDDGPARALKAHRLSAREIEIVIDEGRHHQVRRMLNAVRLGIKALQRRAIGDLVLDISIGAMRSLVRNEIEVQLRYDTHSRR